MLLGRLEGAPRDEAAPLALRYVSFIESAFRTRAAYEAAARLPPAEFAAAEAAARAAYARQPSAD